MLKKVFIATALCATASFATWDKFPVLENHKGETVVGAGFAKQGEPMILAPYIGSRYTVMPNLELGLVLPYYVNLNINNENGLSNPLFMARYQFLPTLNAFLDVQVPISNDPYNSSEWSFNFGVQYSQNLGIVDIGAELGLMVNTKGDDKVSPPLNLNLGFEIDFKLGIPLTPFIGADALMAIGKLTDEFGNFGDDLTGDFAVLPYVGLKYAFTSNVSVQASAMTMLGKEDMVGPDTPIVADLRLKMSF